MIIFFNGVLCNDKHVLLSKLLPERVQLTICFRPRRMIGLSLC